MGRRVIDHRTLLSKKSQAEVAEPLSTRWWTKEGQEAANGISSTLNALHQAQDGRQSQMLAAARLYGNMSLLAPLGMGNNLASLKVQQSKGSSYNIVQSVVDAITAKVAKTKPSPLFLTNGGNFHQQRRAQRLSDYVEGVFYENRVPQLAVQTFRDACVWGSGLVFVYAHNGRVKLERVIPSELYVDEAEGFYGEPRQMHRVKAVDRQMLVDAYPEHAERLKQMDPSKDQALPYNSTADLVQVRESWHLPSGPDADDGKHMVTVAELVLAEEEWDKPFFPFAKFDWAPKMYGYWGQGLAEQLQGIQTEINQLSWIAQRSFYMAGSFKVLVENGSKVVKEHLTNDVGAVVTYNGTKPEYVIPPVISPQHLQRIETLKQSAYEQAGISQLSASSQKPAGLNSGRALRELTDIESDRFTVVGNAYGEFHLQLARLIVAVSKDIAEKGSSKDLNVRKPGKNALRSIDWSSCAMDEDEFITQLFPVSALPNEPAGRLQTIQEYIQAGILSPERGRRLLDFPDLAADNAMASAFEDYLIKVLDGIVDDGEYTPPDGYFNLQEARSMAQQYYFMGCASDLEPERLQMLRDFIDQVDQLVKEASQPQMPADDTTPQANPEATPTSDLVPNVPGVAA